MSDSEFDNDSLFADYDEDQDFDDVFISSQGHNSINMSDLSVNEEEMGNEPVNKNAREIKRCLNCNLVIGNVIPHVKNNEQCFGAYAAYWRDMFGPRFEPYDLERLKKARKAEYDLVVKQDPEYKARKNAAMRMKRKSNKIENCFDNFSAEVEKILSEVCSSCKCTISKKNCQEVEEGSAYYPHILGNNLVIPVSMTVCKMCIQIIDRIEQRWKLSSEAVVTREFDDWERENFTLESELLFLRVVLDQKYPNIGKANLEYL